MEIFRHWRPQLPHISEVLIQHQEEILKALQDVRPKVPPTRYFSDVKAASGIAPSDVEGPLMLAIDLYTLMDIGRLPPETFLEEVHDELHQVAEESEEVQDEVIYQFLDSALRLHETLGVAAKSRHLWSESERIYCSSRILTDLRPIFDPPDAEQPQAFLPMHELKLTFHPSGDYSEFEDFRLQLDSRHLRKLQSEIKRALNKEKALSSRIRDAGLEVLPTDEGE